MESDATPREPSLKLIRSLLSEADAELLAERSNRAGLEQTVFHLSCIAITVAMVLGTEHWWSYSAATLLEAFVLAFLFMPLHESVHGTAFRSPRLNHITSHICGFLTLRPAIEYRYYHFAHHRYTGDPKMDPELQASSLTDLPITSIPRYFLYLSGVPFWIDRCITILSHACGVTRPAEYYISSSMQKGRVTAEARWLLITYSALALWAIWTQSAFFLWKVWVLPSLLAQPFLRFHLLAEHLGCEISPKMLTNTRTTTTWGWYRRLSWNMPYHSEHHAFPHTPFHRLSALHTVCAKALKTQDSRGCVPSGGGGYVALHCALLRKLCSASRD
eukprot:NODE_2070_length_1306_cov_36.054893_g1883_i0.p1 GENE.NODE_2070_length_1306_cov_36.054893_g1883_i0~~NODE_2070_length_1306_cov_36.054893_g1883_i0.p1  ORF type:complete len:331 (-),score=32.47 NODE_2070_length_1306_cov_36.054893_g1883_i0:192-1184(-)